MQTGGQAFRFIYAFHLPLFYLLMGLVFPYSLTFKKYLHKSKKLFLYFILFLLIGIVLTLAIPSFRAAFAFGRNERFKLLYQLQPECFNVGQLWFLFNALIVITLYYFLGRLAFWPKGLQMKTKEMLLTAAIFVLGAAGFLAFNNSDGALSLSDLRLALFHKTLTGVPPLPWKLDTAICALPFFYIGVLLNRNGFKFRLYRVKWG